MAEPIDPVLLRGLTQRRLGRRDFLRGVAWERAHSRCRDPLRLWRHEPTGRIARLLVGVGLRPVRLRARRGPEYGELAPDNILHLESREADQRVLQMMDSGDHAGVIDWMPEYRKAAPESHFGHYLMMASAPGGERCQAPGECFADTRPPPARTRSMSGSSGRRTHGLGVAPLEPARTTKEVAHGRTAVERDGLRAAG